MSRRSKTSSRTGLSALVPPDDAIPRGDKLAREPTGSDGGEQSDGRASKLAQQATRRTNKDTHGSRRTVEGCRSRQWYVKEYTAGVDIASVNMRTGRRNSSRT